MQLDFNQKVIYSIKKEKKSIIERISNVVIMGTLNITPDSFSDGGENFSPEDALSTAKEMVEWGAEILDVGGESTRPGSDPVTLEEELSRVLPVIETLRNNFDDIVISIDTYKSPVAEKSLLAGANWINDISGGTFDPNIFNVASKYDATIIVSHIKGTPRDMQKNPEYTDVVREVKEYLSIQANKALQAGVKKERIIIDPGIGFGKKYEHNIQLLNAIPQLCELGYPVLVGSSRKSFIGHFTGENNPSMRDPASYITFLWSILLGAKYIRTHNVRGTTQMLRMTRTLVESI